MPEAIKKFYRSRTDRVIWGVCGGLGEYFAIDSVWFRIMFVVLALVNGFGILLYLILALAVSNNPRVKSVGADRVKDLAQELSTSAKKISGEMKTETGHQARNILGLVVLTIGIVMLLQEFFHIHLNWSLVYPFLIILLGLYFLDSYNKK